MVRPLPDCFCALILLVCHCAFALDPTRDISQYAHKSWRIRDGFPDAAAESIAQTSDGYLWLGTTSGLVRFDGVNHVILSPPGNKRPPNHAIRALLAARDGSLWIGMRDGLARWGDQRFTDFEELTGFDVYSLLQDHEGTIWAGAGYRQPAPKLCAIQGNSVHCTQINAGVTAFYEDSRRNLWVAVTKGLWRWKPQPSKFYPLMGPNQLVTAISELKSGEIVVGTRDGIHRFANGVFDSQPFAGSDRYGTIRRLMRDRDAGIWIGTNRGLLRMHDSRSSSYTRLDGLSGDPVDSLFEDREGNIWVATLDGLDQFRDYAIPTISHKQGLRSALAVLAGPDGSTWITAGTYGLYRWKDGEVTNYHVRRALPTAIHDTYRIVDDRAREVIDQGLGEGVSGTLATDAQGRLWVAGLRTLSIFTEGRFSRGPVFEDEAVRTMASDSAHGLWISHSSQGLIHLDGKAIAERVDWKYFGSRGPAVSIQPDTKRGGIWLGFATGGIAYFDHGRPSAFYDRRKGLGDGEVKSLYFDEHGTLWAGTEGGLSRLNNGRFQTLTTANGLPCSVIQWVIQDDDRSFWLGTACGVVRIDERELDRWASGTSDRVHSSVFDATDGVRSQDVVFDGSPIVTKARDGKLWFSVPDGVSIIDPRHLLANPVPPPVQVERIVANHTTYDATAPLKLPPLTRDLEIDFTALSFVAPERVQFRYRLEGHDHDWQSVGNRRQAFYTDLPPGDYRFRAIASNNSGVWNEQGGVLDFSITPAYYQTNWFRALCFAASLALLWLAYWLRMRHVANQFNRTLDARVAERTRIARELHDTLLQSFHAVLMRFQAISNHLQHGQTKEELDGAIAEAAEAITEGREAVQGLRASAVETNDLALAIKTAAEELAASQAGNGSVALTVVVEGSSRTLHPIVRDEIYRIGCEALRNAFRHADAGKIDVGLHYGERELRLRVRDDGKGIDPKFLAQEGRPGHFGLHGMRERAGLIGGKLTVHSALDFGTEVELMIPAARAYAGSGSERRSWFTEKLSGKTAPVDS